MGVLSLRLPESLHARIKDLAAADGVSANQFITLAIAERAAALGALQDAGVKEGPERAALTLAAELGARDDSAPGLKPRLLAFAQHLREMRHLVDAGRDRFVADWINQRAAERTLQLAIDAQIALAHALARVKQLSSDSPHDIVQQLAKAGVIDANLAAVLSRQVTMKTLLARGDVRLDADRVYEMLRVDAPEMARFGELARKALKGSL